MDPLSHVLNVGRVSGAVLAILEAAEPWGLSIEPQPGAVFHAVLSGTCLLKTGDAEAIRLMPGDVVLLPGHAPHRLLSGADVPTMSFDRVVKDRLRGPDGRLQLPGDGPVARILCASYDYDHHLAHPLMQLLPEVLHLPVGTGPRADAVALTLALLRGEADAAPGASAASGRLIDVLLVHVVRAWLDAQPHTAVGWLPALRDPLVGAALTLLHDRPDDPWSAASLAAELHVSRATLNRRFSELVGQPPLHYLTRWRLDLAARELRDTDRTVYEVARRVGYTNESAFSRAFRRERGVPPSRYRTLHLRAGAERAAAQPVDSPSTG